MKTRLILVGLFAQICFAESPFIIGVRGGVPLGDVIHTVQSGSTISSATDHYVVGPTVGIRLPAGFSVTADALFTRLTLSATSAPVGSISASATSWEFPVLLRFTAGREGIAPFVDAGVSVRHLSDFGNIGPFLTNSASSTGNVIGTPATVGFALGAGLQFKLAFLHISPEIRYTHWGENHISAAFQNVIRTNDNEGQILVGLTF
jgi:opacity protein-like surface antigen